MPLTKTQKIVGAIASAAALNVVNGLIMA